ncbi:AI-2E family transporter [Carboxylicivirga mesophila]|uniref:AI-2E family transporter n=1 Tax=Carboxylicivirga mesophila TaxID=1166478 RepID=A0ABS5KC33_9BACT|nr:AI-2E family transporter [Carboxylicivirga mesophila]MBS2212501.1 AI-2E family transporter [Carboxylicivirga mesophila]
MNDLKTTNTLLLIIVIPFIFYLLKVLSFIFIPLVLAMFISLLFLPIMRWLAKKRVPKTVSLLLVIIVITGVFKVGGELIKLSSQEILSADSTFFKTAEEKLVGVIVSVEDFFGITRVQGESVFSHYFKNNNMLSNIGVTIDFIGNALSLTLTTAFFVILLLSGTMNFEKLLNSTLFKVRYSSVKAFRQVEKDIIKFVQVKFFISLLTGIGFSLACVFFNVSFPIFWGLFAFAINFVQMIGSIISVVLLALFALVELDQSGTLLFFIVSIIAVQGLMGGVLEPIFMGKTFSVNVIVILIMLMLWGYIWGIPGLILSIPLTVFAKICFDQFPRYKVVSNIISGDNSSGKRA